MTQFYYNRTKFSLRVLKRYVSYVINFVILSKNKTCDIIFFSFFYNRNGLFLTKETT